MIRLSVYFLRILRGLNPLNMSPIIRFYCCMEGKTSTVKKQNFYIFALMGVGNSPYNFG